MKYEFKAPETLTFSAEEAPELNLIEDQFYASEQNTAIELEKLKSRKQDRKERKKYAQRIFNFIRVWCLGIFIVIILTGVDVFKFNTSIIITLITTTTANILTLFYLVTKYLFSRPVQKNK